MISCGSDYSLGSLAICKWECGFPDRIYDKKYFRYMGLAIIDLSGYGFTLALQAEENFHQ